MKRVIVTGGSGKVGRACVEELLRHDYEVFNVDAARPAKERCRFTQVDFTDFGQTVALRALGRRAHRSYPEMSVGQGCVQELERLGFEPNSVAYVLQSHLHLDQGAVGRFPNAIHVVQRAEYEYAFTPDWFAAPSYIRKDFDRPDLQ